MTSMAEKGGGTFQGIKLLLCENPLPPVDEVIVEDLNSPTKSIRLPAPRAQLHTCTEALGPGFMRITTALPEDNRRFVDALREVMSHA